MRLISAISPLVLRSSSLYWLAWEDIWSNWVGEKNNRYTYLMSISKWKTFTKFRRKTQFNFCGSYCEQFLIPKVKSLHNLFYELTLPIQSVPNVYVGHTLHFMSLNVLRQSEIQFENGISCWLGNQFVNGNVCILCLPWTCTKIQPLHGSWLQSPHIEPWLQPQYDPCWGFVSCPFARWRMCP